MSDNIINSIEKQEEFLEKSIYLNDRYITINVLYEYNIELSRCDSLEKILGWATHLCEKSWMTADLLRRFIHISARAHGLSIPST